MSDTQALDEKRVSREAIRPPDSGVDELEYWRGNAMHYHGLCVALEDEIDNWNLAIDGKNAAIRRRDETISEMRQWNKLLELELTNLRSVNQENSEDAAAETALLAEMRHSESIRNGDLCTALEACREALLEAADSGVVLRLTEDAIKRAEHTLEGSCWKCGGSRILPLPEKADACNCQP